MPKADKLIIVGGGLAGTVLALSCLEKNIPFVLLDQPKADSSSRVAAGMWNPVTFKKGNLSWEAVPQIKKLHSFYAQWEKTLDARFFHPMKSEKLVPNAEYYNNWSARSSATPYSQFLGDLQPVLANDYPILINKDKATVAQVMHAGYLDVPVFLDAAHLYLKNKGLYQEKEYLYAEALIDSEKVVFAEGFGLKNNPYFNYLPLNGTHGDILTIKANITSDRIFNFGKFLLPLPNGLFRYGSTYNWAKKDSDISEEGKQDLIEHWNKHFTTPFEIVEQKAGLRPTVKDRIPLVGQHPEYNHLYCFNGLGTKGVMIAPWLAENFVDSLMGLTEWNKAVNIDRFEALWKK
jgi:glycine/D-amino acid oxidase-like deaminating enzyme